jgi:hypothetical protein
MSENTVNIFERASQLKLRIATAAGNVIVEDLWDIQLTSSRSVSLDDIAKGLRRVIKDREEESFVTKPSKANEELQLAFDIVKHIIEVKLTEAEVARAKADNREKKQKLLQLIAEKKDEQLKTSSIEELQAQVEAL